MSITSKRIIEGALAATFLLLLIFSSTQPSSANLTQINESLTAPIAPPAGVGKYVFEINQENDDGVELNETEWFEDGLGLSTISAGRESGDRYTAGLRFLAWYLEPGEEVAFARLRFASQGGELDSSAHLIIKGVLQNNSDTFSADSRPSQKTPKTNSQIEWGINESWVNPSDSDSSGGLLMPLFYSSPDISPIINEITALPDWGRSGFEKNIAIVIEDDASRSSGVNYVSFDDFVSTDSSTPPVKLEVYKSVYDTFLGKELVGRVSDKSATVNLYSLINTDTYIQYGTAKNALSSQTAPHLNSPAELPIEIVLENLSPDTEYYYRLAYRRAGDPTYQFGEVHSFHTQRSPGSPFTFSATADSHVQYPKKINPNLEDMLLYRQTLKNVENAKPDFFISLGDLANLEFIVGRNVATLPEAKDYYLNVRSFLDTIGHSTPFYQTVGNHEGEQGWYYTQETPGQNFNDLAVITTMARKEVIPNPYPDGFYSGNTDLIPEYGLREDYYAWEWGDALFAVIDPYWYSKNPPYNEPDTEYPMGDGWSWTLGEEQYNWLYDTLHNSDAKWKFIFTHQLLVEGYGRGGVELAKHKVAGNPSYEWGGEDENGNLIFNEMRPGWSHGPIHDMLVAEGVDIVFHAHDHFFAKQELDGIVYQEVPKTSDSSYTIGLSGFYKEGVLLPSSGHLNIHVEPEKTKVDYIRSYLLRDGENGKLEYSYTLEKPDRRTGGGGGALIEQFGGPAISDEGNSF